MDASLLSLDFPAWPAAEHPCAPPAGLAEAVGSAPAECFSIPEMHGGDYYLFVYATEAEVAGLAPNIDGMKANVLATARRPISTRYTHPSPDPNPSPSPNRSPNPNPNPNA